MNTSRITHKGEQVPAVDLTPNTVIRDDNGEWWRAAYPPGGGPLRWYDVDVVTTPDGRTEDTVNHPAHYGGDTTYEAIKVINAWGLGFELGSALKYLCRAEHKGAPIEDLKKAVWYIQHEIDRREAQP